MHGRGDDYDNGGNNTLSDVWVWSVAKRGKGEVDKKILCR